MSQLADFTAILLTGQDLSEAESMVAAEYLTLPEIGHPDKLAFLTALQDKGDSVAEVTAFAKVFRKLATDPHLADFAGEAIDIVGTGGSGSAGYNISSATSLVVAAAGSKVLKHGNRSITSKSGSADFLSTLGIHMVTDQAILRKSVEELNFCFFFAPAFHPAFKEIMPVRQQLAQMGKRSIFNVLGPLINPAKAAYQLLGAFCPSFVTPLAQALHELGLKRGIAVSCVLPDGNNMDELTTVGINHVKGFGGMDSLDCQWTPADVGFLPEDPVHLRGGSAAENVLLFEDILDGKGRSGLVDTIVLNAAAAFLILERVENLEEGCALAREVLLGGALRQWLVKARAFYHDLPEEK